MEADGNIISALIWDKNTERYRSGHNEAVLKTVCPKGRMGSNPILSAYQHRRYRLREQKCWYNFISLFYSKKYPSWPKGHPWKGCRSLIAARGFKSLLLRSLDRHIFWVVETIQKKSKKVVDKTVDTRYTNQADCESETKREQPLRKKQKKNKKVVDKRSTVWYSK